VFCTAAHHQEPKEYRGHNLDEDGWVGWPRQGAAGAADRVRGAGLGVGGYGWAGAAGSAGQGKVGQGAAGAADRVRGGWVSLGEVRLGRCSRFGRVGRGWVRLSLVGRG
jgi:hypothetical protein